MALSSRANLLFLSSFSLFLGAFAAEGYAAPLQILYEFQTTEKKEASLLKSLMGKGDETIQKLDSKVLASIPLEDLAKKKQQELSEIDPHSGTKAKFKGVSLSALVDQSSTALSAEDKSHIDLVILKSRDGKSVLMPRDFLQKYPTIQLALAQDGKPLGDDAPRVILPATTNAKMRRENLVLDPLFVSQLSEVKLTSYQFYFADLYLKKRTDPAAVRGEKFFFQNCVGCHGGPGGAPGVAAISAADRITKLAEGHPSVPGAGKLKSILDARHLRSLSSYLEAFRYQTAAK